MIPVSEQELLDYNSEMRTKVDSELTAASNDRLKFVHARNGLAYDMYPTKNQKVNTADCGLGNVLMDKFKEV